MSNTINATLHSHLLAGFGDWWREKEGIQGKNLAEVVTDRCLKKDLGIVVITNDFPEEFREKSRFHQFSEEVDRVQYPFKSGQLGNNSLIVEKDIEGKVIYINGQSVADRILTFGTSSVPKDLSLEDAARYLSDEGLIRIAEHPFAGGHHGALTEEQLLELWDKEIIDAAEHNGKLAVRGYIATPCEIISQLHPRLKNLKRFGDYKRDYNQKLERFCEQNNIPLVANDDSDRISQIGTAYTIFDKEKLRFNKEENLIEDLNTLIISRNFETHKGQLAFPGFLRYIYLVLKSGEQINFSSP